MRIVNKIIIGIALSAIVFLFVCIQVAQGSVYSTGNIENKTLTPVIANLDIYYDMTSYNGYFELENTGNENITVVVVIYVDGNRTVEEEVALNIDHFKGFPLLSRETLEFEVPCEEGDHEVHVNVIIDNITIYADASYIALGEVEEAEAEVDEVADEVAEDWLECS